MTGIEALPVIGGDEPIHSLLREFDDEPALDQHGDDFTTRLSPDEPTPCFPEESKETLGSPLNASTTIA